MSKLSDAFPEPTSQLFIEAVEKGDAPQAIARSTAVPAGVNIVGAEGETALLLAVMRLDKPMVVALLKAGAKADGGPDRSPLAIAVQARDTWFATTLLNAGASPDATSGGETPLFRAVLVNRIDMINILLDAGALPDAPNALGVTPSMTAAKIDDFLATKRLLDRGGSPFASDRRGVSLAYITSISTLSPSSPQGRARQMVVDQLRQSGVPWPPPQPREVVSLKARGQWPPASR